jgi:hypothetical protein
VFGNVTWAGVRLLRTGVRNLVTGAMKPVIAVDDRCHFARVVLSYIGIDVASDYENPSNRLGIVPDLVAPLGAARKRQHIAFLQDAVTVMHQDGRRPPKNDEQLFASVMEVVDELRRPGLKLPNRCAEGIRRRPNKFSCSESTPIWNLVPNIRGVLAHALRILQSRAALWYRRVPVAS